MSCSYANHRQTATANAVDSISDYLKESGRMLPENAKFFKFGSVFTVGNIIVSAATGQYYDAFQGAISGGVGYMAGSATTAIVGAGIATFATGVAATSAVAVALPVVAGLVIGTSVSIAIDNYMDSFQKCEDPAKDFKPNKDETPEKDYHKKYYDPIILDLNGNGVGTVVKFGVLFMINGGAMFDHDGNGIATQAGWVAVNDEWWEMVV